jgi:hypothetical protein
LRKKHGVVSFEICKHCPDENIEKWDFGGPINIEPKKGVIDNDPTGNGNGNGLNSIINSDYQFEFKSIKPQQNTSTSTTHKTLESDFSDLIKTSNVGITIAIIDTGIDLSYMSDFTAPFLYKSSIPGVLSGWDYVNNDPYPNDDYSEKHGTDITRTIHKGLYITGVAHQILPIKAFNDSGVGSYFNVLCATYHALTNANIVNMSFGWYDDGFGDFDNTIFANLLTEHPDVIVVASAGNDCNNNDVNTQYPSGYPNSNIFAVAATDDDLLNKASYSNYGSSTVDYFASGYSNALSFELEGTSFAAPKVTLKIASFFHGETPFPSLGTIIYSLNSVSTINFDPYHVKYDRVITP